MSTTTIIFASFASSILNLRTTRRSNQKTTHFLGNRSLLSLNPNIRANSKPKMDISVKNNILPDNIPPVLPSGSPPGSWQLWVVGFLTAVILPFFRSKWGPLLKLKEEVDTAMETADKLADVVEDVAVEVEKIADKIGDQLPEGKLRKAANFVEDLAEKTIETSNRIDDALDKIEALEDKLEDMIEGEEDKKNEKDEKKSQEAKDGDKSGTTKVETSL
ncbi:hypothetical protein UlMin_035125 [Ulmus minor]